MLNRIPSTESRRVQFVITKLFNVIYNERTCIRNIDKNNLASSFLLGFLSQWKKDFGIQMKINRLWYSNLYLSVKYIKYISQSLLGVMKYFVLFHRHFLDWEFVEHFLQADLRRVGLQVLARHTASLEWGKFVLVNINMLANTRVLLKILQKVPIVPAKRWEVSEKQDTSNWGESLIKCWWNEGILPDNYLFDDISIK